MSVLQVDGCPVVTVGDIAKMFGKKEPNVYIWLSAPNFPKPVHIIGRKQRLFLKSEVEAWHQLMAERKGRIQTLRSRLIAMDIADLEKVESLILHQASARPRKSTK